MRLSVSASIFEASSARPIPLRMADRIRSAEKRTSALQGVVSIISWALRARKQASGRRLLS